MGVNGAHNVGARDGSSLFHSPVRAAVVKVGGWGDTSTGSHLQTALFSDVTGANILSVQKTLYQTFSGPLSCTVLLNSLCLLVHPHGWKNK